MWSVISDAEYSWKWAKPVHAYIPTSSKRSNLSFHKRMPHTSIEDDNDTFNRNNQHPRESIHTPQWMLAEHAANFLLFWSTDAVSRFIITFV